MSSGAENLRSAVASGPSGSAYWSGSTISASASSRPVTAERSRSAGVSWLRAANRNGVCAFLGSERGPERG
jgi:hypothetical protein